MIKAAALKATPTSDNMEMMLMKFFFRFERRYLCAMKNSRFTGNNTERLKNAILLMEGC